MLHTSLTHFSLPCDAGEALENAKVKHEATVVAVAKMRKEYPHYLSKLLGKTMRLKKNTAVCIPFLPYYVIQFIVIEKYCSVV